jgi:hypothetical protein
MSFGGVEDKGHFWRVLAAQWLNHRRQVLKKINSYGQSANYTMPEG